LHCRAFALSMQMLSERGVEPQRGHHPAQVVEVAELQRDSPVAAGDMNLTAYCNTALALVGEESE
jgi:hypothetical protein